MIKQFVLRIWYGTGKTAMIVDTPDLIKALQQFKNQYEKSLPDVKCYGLPDIFKAEIIPIAHKSIYEKEED